MSVLRWSLATSSVVFREPLLPPPPLLLGQPTRPQQRHSVSVCGAEWQRGVLCNVLVLLLVAKTQLAMQTVPTRHKQFQRSITVPDDTFRSRFLVRLDTTRYYYCKWSENMKEIIHLGELGVDRNVMYPSKARTLWMTYFNIQNSALCPHHACIYVLRIIQTTAPFIRGWSDRPCNVSWR